jgi:hypothetical protein
LFVCCFVVCGPITDPGSVASAAASSRGPLILGCSLVSRCVLLAAPSLPESGLAAYGASARSPSSLLTWLLPPRACITLPLHGTAADRALAFPATGCPSADDVVVRVATARRAWLYTTSLSASPPREALGCPPVASRLSHAPARPIMARLSRRTGAPRPRVASPTRGSQPQHRGCVAQRATRVVRKSPVAKRPVSALAFCFGVSQVGNAGNIPG